MENTPFWIGSPSSRIEAAENSNKKHATRSNPLNLLVEGSRTKRSYRNGLWRFGLGNPRLEIFEQLTATRGERERGRQLLER
ncbi:hypothetical protein MRB53_028949 [Persea americana]|uniref:Uncharacterized protein n=1 Tax=Persea americana TaxID=3435 RepID=A0ACC2KGZ2_PERAE|nr:hypothetical protein MRB53_028949 [Persea americana]